MTASGVVLFGKPHKKTAKNARRNFCSPIDTHGIAKQLLAPALFDK